MADYASLLPPLTTEEFAALKADIKANGQRDAICVDEDGNVLDGRHRLKILGKNAKRTVVKGLTEAEKKAFVFRSNFTRRNLTGSQKKEARKTMKAVAKELRAEDAKTYTQAKLGAAFGVARETVRDWGLFGKDTSNGETANTCTVPPDGRTKVDQKHKPIIAQRVASGETQAQVAADYGVSQQAVSTVVKAETKQAEATKTRKAAAKKIKGNSGIFTGDFRTEGKHVAEGSVSLIFTDPPYDKEAASLYADLAAFASRVLRPGGWCLAYSGQAHLPEVLGGMSDHLTYGWTFAIRHSGGDLRFRKFKLQNGWKPIVGFYKKPLGTITWDWFPDMATGGKEKDDHEWQQAEGEAAHFIEAMTIKGELVCDPFCGSGTTCVASKRLGRKWIAIEVDEDTANKAKERIAGE